MTPDLSDMTPDELREIMARLELTQQKLARRIGVNQASVSHWLAGRNQPLPPIRALIRLLTRTND